MHFYQLESKATDEAFLLNKIVHCPATLSKEQLDSLKPGNKIVIQLSTRSKYMGTIRDLKFELRAGKAIGFLEVIRSIK
jgi:hypothetical protein